MTKTQRLHQLAAWICLTPVELVLHESAHVLAGKAFGLRTRRVVLGSGQTVRVVRVFGVRVELREHFIELDPGGLVEQAYDTALPWWQDALVSLAGPAASIAWWALLVCLTRHLHLIFWIPRLYAMLAFVGCSGDFALAWNYFTTRPRPDPEPREDPTP